MVTHQRVVFNTFLTGYEPRFAFICVLTGGSTGLHHKRGTSSVLFDEPPVAASAGFVSDYISRNCRFELPLLLVNASRGRFIFAVSTNQDLGRQAQPLVALEREQLWSPWSGSSS